MITGGTGFLGSYLARYMVQEKGELGLVLLDMYPNDNTVKEIRDQVTVVQGDICDSEEVLSTMKKHQVERVVHLAYFLTVGIEANPVQGIAVNCSGTANIFDAALRAGVRRVVYASSARVYGSNVVTLTNEPLTEDTPPSPSNIYGACKLMNDYLARVYYEKHGLDVIGMRPTTTFGAEKGRGAPGAQQEIMVRPEMAALGEPVVLPPDDQYLDWMYAADAAQAWYLALTVEHPPHRIFNMTSEARPTGEITAYLRRLLPEAQITVSKEPLPTMPLISNQRLRQELGFAPRYTVEEGLRESFNRARAQAGLPPLAAA